MIRYIYDLMNQSNYVFIKEGKNMKKARNTNMDSAISIASFVIESLKGDYLGVARWFEYYDVLEKVIEKWQKPYKKTLVHDYIQDLYLERQNYTLDKHFPVVEISEMQSLLENYKVDYLSIGKIDVSELSFDECTDELENYAYKLQRFFIDKILDTIVDDAFSILYMDKNFLHEFNRQCSKIIKDLKMVNYPDLLKEDGVIKRISYYPTWFKKGIKYRDKCRCSLCGCDLSSSFTTIVDENFDHIIPLKAGGNNDPSNWQLTCETCNKSKGARGSEFKNIMFPFWEMED